MAKTESTGKKVASAPAKVPHRKKVLPGELVSKTQKSAAASPERAMAKSAERTVLEIRRIGNSLGLTLSKELLARARLRLGDKLLVSEGPGGTLTLSPYQSDDAEALRIARELMVEYAETFRALAK